MEDREFAACTTVQPLLADFCHNQTSVAQSLEIRQHIRNCLSCRCAFFREAGTQLFRQHGSPQRPVVSGVSPPRKAHHPPEEDRSGSPPPTWTLLLNSEQSAVPKRRGDRAFSLSLRQDFTFALSRCETIPEILEWLYGAALCLGLRNVRYHFFSQCDGRLVSVDGIGHAPRVEIRLRSGCVLQRPVTALPSDCDSYLCFYYGCPVVFQIDQSVPGVVGPQWLTNELPHFRLPRDHCENLLLTSKHRTWVDFPLAMLGRFVGKLSCDLADQEVSPCISQQLYEFWRLAQTAAPYLDTAYAGTVNHAFQAARQDIEGRESRASLPLPLS